jgi:hypothetical protein
MIGLHAVRQAIGANKKRRLGRYIAQVGGGYILRS